MKHKQLFLLSLAAVLVGFGLDATAGAQNPGSLLLYPEFDNRSGDVTVFTLTNAGAATVDVEFVYVGVQELPGGSSSCEEFSRTETLTGHDTLTLLTRVHNPQQERGFAYAFAKEAGSPIDHDWLIGNTIIIDGVENLDYSVNALSFEGLADGDTNANGLRDLDGVEYAGAPSEVLVPRFFGQGGCFQGELILIGLSGGAAFETVVDLHIFNDNGVEFSQEHTFHCWEKRRLSDISGVFSGDFLRTTDHDSGEILGASQYESGWFKLRGVVANSPTTSIYHPAVYGVLIERIGSVGVSDLPFSTGQNFNGKLFPQSNDGQL